MSVCAYADADWGNDKNDRKSITGWIAMINGDPISWASKKQKVVAQSTCEAELCFRLEPEGPGRRMIRGNGWEHAHSDEFQ